MHEIIALVAPSLIAVGFYSHLHRDKLSTQKLISAFGIFLVLINLFMYLFIIYLFGNQEVSFEGKKFVDYLIGSFILAILLPFVVNLVGQTVGIEVKRNAKKK
ncbi:MAG TPA: hypothetical protein PKD19_03980 [Candidatus Saccharibacteria bacterium]|jgi:uncharacterized membrane protein YvlD (DUF360 family)|nr:hypothetical protein [Candidatus Saccharibacteria bacterium]HMR38329.1 hypothetical protein [Candidatus Saccharibacteria bacterium]